MKRSDWFICLPYPDFDVLFPKEDILSSSCIKEECKKGKKTIDIDSFFVPKSEAEGFGDSAEFDDINRRKNEKNKTELEVGGGNGIVLQTSIIPELVQADFCEFRNFGADIGKAFLKRGIISVRFLGNRVQYLFDANVIRC